jgi:hypothetical protein
MVRLSLHRPLALVLALAGLASASCTSSTSGDAASGAAGETGIADSSSAGDTAGFGEGGGVPGLADSAGGESAAADGQADGGASPPDGGESADGGGSDTSGADVAGAPDGELVGVDDELDETCGYGSLYGLVCSPSKQQFVNGARVWIDTVDCAGAPLWLETTTNADGAYVFHDSVPSGYQTVHVELGSIITTRLVLIKAGKVSDISGAAMKECYQVFGDCPTGAIVGTTCLSGGAPLPGPGYVWTQATDCNGALLTVEATIDDKGQYLLDDVPVGTVWVFAQWQGQLVQVEVTVEEGSTTVLSPIEHPEICFPKSSCPSGAVQGKVCQPDGAGWQAGATAAIAGLDCNGESVSITAASDGAGEFWLSGVPAGEHWITVQSPLGSWQVKAVVPAGGIANVGIVGAAQCNPDTCLVGAVAGSICPSGVGSSPAAGAVAYVNALDCNGSTKYLQTTVGSDGSYFLAGVPKGLVWVFVEWQGMVYQNQVNVESGKTATANPLSPPQCAPQPTCQFGAVTGQICKPTGDGFVQSASVKLAGVDCAGKPVSLSATTDTAGQFQLVSVPVGQQWISIDSPFASYQLPVSVLPNQTSAMGLIGSPSCDPNPCKFGGIQGTVCTVPGVPVSTPATVTVQTTDCKGAPKTVSVSSGAGGAFVLTGVPVGTVNLVIQWNGQVKQIPVVVTPGQLTTVPMLQADVCFPPPACGVGAVTGRLCKPDGTAWVAAATASLSSVDCNGQPFFAQATTDANGVFWITGVPAGSHVVQVQGPFGPATVPVSVAQGATTDVGVVGAPSCNPGGGCGAGTITGWACAPSGVKVPGATISVSATNCQGQAVTLTGVEDGQGNFTVTNVPSGTVTVTVVKGDYQVSYTVTVANGGTTSVPSVVQAYCFPDKQVKLAVVGGSWDNIEKVLDKLGLSYDFYDAYSGAAASLLSDLPLMSKYDVIFFNCGVQHTAILGQNPWISQNIKLYVQAGHSIYASDWAHIYAETPFPDAIDFHADDNNWALPKVGPAAVVDAQVSHSALAGYLGKSSLPIHFDIGSWVLMSAAPLATTVCISGSVPGFGVAPLMVSHYPFGGTGKVLFTSFHNNPNISGDVDKILKFTVFEL